MSAAPQQDVIIVGGGLSGGLLAWRLRQLQPALKVCLIEGGTRLGGNHTWSFFESDLTTRQNAWIDPLVGHRWPGYEVRFPKLKRELATGYRSVTSERFHDVVSASLGDGLVSGAKVVSVSANRVQLDDQRSFDAPCVIDARGAHASPHLLLGFQKFLGLAVRLTEPHGRRVPIIMDATVAQDDGYRFVYTLPLAPDRLLIEDTYYSDGGDLAPEGLRARISGYAGQQGWHIAEVVREETGVLPIILAGDIERFLEDHRPGAPRIGLGAALFHPTTGYSLPDAVRLADRLATAAPLTTGTARDLVQTVVRDTWQQRSFFRMLNRFLFKAGRPAERYEIMERFYGLGEGLIQNFYASRLSPAQKLRILAGKPPVPIHVALRYVSEKPMLKLLRGE